MSITSAYKLVLFALILSAVADFSYAAEIKPSDQTAETVAEVDDRTKSYQVLSFASIVLWIIIIIY